MRLADSAYIHRASRSQQAALAVSNSDSNQSPLRGTSSRSPSVTFGAEATNPSPQQEQRRRGTEGSSPSRLRAITRAVLATRSVSSFVASPITAGGGVGRPLSVVLKPQPRPASREWAQEVLSSNGSSSTPASSAQQSPLRLNSKPVLGSGNSGIGLVRERSGSNAAPQPLQQQVRPKVDSSPTRRASEAAVGPTAGGSPQRLRGVVSSVLAAQRLQTSVSISAKASPQVRGDSTSLEMPGLMKFPSFSSPLAALQQSPNLAPAFAPKEDKTLIATTAVAGTNWQQEQWANELGPRNSIGFVRPKQLPPQEDKRKEEAPPPKKSAPGSSPQLLCSSNTKRELTSVLASTFAPSEFDDETSPEQSWTRESAFPPPSSSRSNASSQSVMTTRSGPFRVLPSMDRMRKQGLIEFSLPDVPPREAEIERKSMHVMLTKAGIDQFLDDAWAMEYDEQPMSPSETHQQRARVERVRQARSVELFVEQDMPTLFHMKESEHRREALGAARRDQFHWQKTRRPGDITASKNDLERVLESFDDFTHETEQHLLDTIGGGGCNMVQAVLEERPHIIVLIAWLSDDESRLRHIILREERHACKALLVEHVEHEREERVRVETRLAELERNMNAFGQGRQARNVDSGYNAWRSRAKPPPSDSDELM